MTRGGRIAATRSLLGVAVVALVLGSVEPALAQLDEHCTVSVLNRTVRVNPDGTWLLPNVPAATGLVRARATCVEDGVTRSGESDFFVIQPNRMNAIPPIRFDVTTPIPADLAITPSPVMLTAVGETVPLAVEATYPDGTTRDITAAEDGTNYTTSNSAIAEVNGDGLVTARASGTAVIQASNDGTAAIVTVRVLLSTGDSDEDGLPDEYELANALNPNLAIDAREDPDRDGLTNLEEFGAGTNPQLADTDGDRLNDGQEVARGTNPFLPDTDGDGIADGLEVQTASDPLDPASFNLSAALASIAVTPSSFIITFNTIMGEASVQLGVRGDMLDGRTIDLTSRDANFTSSDLTICNFGAMPGEVFAGMSGPCTITVTIAGFTATAEGSIRTFSPVPLGSVAIPGYANNVDGNGSFAFVAAGQAGLVVVDASNPSVPAVVASLDTPGNANDVRVVSNVAYVADGSAGLQIIDVTDPTAPRLLGAADTPGEANDVIVSGSRAFVADGPAGVQIIDVSDPTAPTLLRAVDTPGTARGVDVHRQTVVVVDDSPDAALRVIDVSNPATADIVGSVPLGGAPIDVSVSMGHAYVAAYSGGMSVVDVRQPTAPVVTGGIGGSVLVPRDVQAARQFAIFAEQLFANAVAPIVNVSDPANPQLTGVLDFGEDYAGTGIAVTGPFIYWTGQAFFVGSENGTTGTTRLFIGQYLALEDLNGMPPSVTITAPEPGATVLEGESLTVRAAATDDVAVARVAFTIDGREAFVDTSEPYEYTFVVPAGGSTLALGAVATDLGGNMDTAPTVAVNVVPDPLTTVAGRVIAEDGLPAAGATVSVLGLTAVTGADGSFALAGVSTVRGVLVVNASLTRDETTLSGSSAPTAPVRGGTTDVGDIVVRSTAFETDLGTRIDWCDWCTVTVALPFAFPIGGSTVDRVHVENGYLWTDNYDELEPFCCDLTTNPADPMAGFYVNDRLPDRVVITWFRLRTDDTGDAPNTAQVILFAGGRIQYGYRGVAPGVYTDVGVFPGNATVYTFVDFTANPMFTMGPTEAVDEWFNPGFNPFDLDGGLVVFAPQTAGGYEVRLVPDLVAPMCTIANPASGSTLFRGELLSIVADVTDNGVVRNVVFESDVGGLNQDVTTAPFSTPFTVPVDATAVTFTATAFDTWGNMGTCTSTVNVIQGPPPAAAITSIADGAVLTEGSTVAVTIASANRVPTSRVDLIVNGATLASDSTSPFEFLLTVPSGVGALAVSAAAVNTAGQAGSSAVVNATVLPDPLTTVQGRVIDRMGSGVSGALVSLDVRGVSADIFDFDAPLDGLPDLSGRMPSRRKIFSALNLRNPDGVFGGDPFGFGGAVSHAARFTGRIQIATPGDFTFTLGVREGGRLIVNGTTVVDLPGGSGQFEEASGGIFLPAGSTPIEVLTFDNGNPEVRLSFETADQARQVVAPDQLTPADVLYAAMTTSTGAFSIDAVPTILGAITARASATIDGRRARGTSAAVEPVAGGMTDVGDIRLSAGKIGLLQCDFTDEIRASLIATGLIAADDLVDVNACGAPPTLAALSDFGALLVWSDTPFSQPDALGDVLADFVDRGGGVVLATYVFSQPWRIGGRITAAGYSPFAVSDARFTTSGVLDLAASDTAHPILAGVEATRYFTNRNYTNPALTTGATLIAVDTAGNRVVAVNPSEWVVGISIYPGFGHMGRLFANALDWVR